MIKKYDLKLGQCGETKKANEMSHRYNRLPLLPSGPGGFSRSWSHPFARLQR